MTENGKQPNKTNWKLLASLIKPYRMYFLISSICTLIASCAIFITPLIVSFALDEILQGTASQIPSFLTSVFYLLGTRDFLIHNLIYLGIAILISTGLNCLFTYLRKSIMAKASEGLARDLRNRLYRHLEDVPYDYHKHVNTGDIVQRCSSDVNTVRRFIEMQLMEIVRTLFMVLTAVFLFFSVHWKMACISMCLMPILAVSSFIYFNKIRSYFTDSDTAEGNLSTMIQENLSGIRVVRAFGQQKTEVDRFTKFNADYRDKTYRLSKALAYYWGVSDGIGFFQIGIALFAGIFFAAKGEVSVGTVTLFSTYTSILTWPVRQLGRILSDFSKATVSLGRIDEILSVEAEKEPGKALKPELIGDIVFDHVCFGYDTPDQVLKDICFHVKQGQTVGILGPTGSGKSSLVQLLQRLYPVTRGKILINGTNINDIERHYLRENIGIVLQEPFLYSRSILDNIRIVTPDASREEVIEAAKTASIHDDILSFDKQYGTIVGERGVTLSGGQRQRVAIARTLMQHAPIMIFDDSMSAVDAETDFAIREHLRSLYHKGIVFLISHRITTLCEADIILVLDQGRIIESGTHEELLYSHGLYHRIAEIQDMTGGEKNA